MKKTLLLLLLLAGATALRAQYNLPQSRIWAMGNKVGLDFTNPASPQPINTALANANEAAASVCDSAGQLLFYTNGMQVWNRNGALMPNGGALISSGSTLSTAQGALIVPVPDSAGKYYLFSLTAVSNCKLYCNKIDMSLAGGLGDVVTTFPLRYQSLADSFLTEKMSAVAGCNNNVWLMVHSQGSPVFRAYNITAAGISTAPVLSAAGNFAGSYYQQGVIKFSPNRDRLLNSNFRASAANDAGLEVFDFNYQTGVVSNAVTLSNGSFYGASFSPEGGKVYAGSTAVLNNGSISQWNLSAASPAASATVLGPCGQYTDMKIGPDGKVYFGALVKSNGYNNYRFMGRINQPDAAGAACNFQDSVTAIIFPHATNANIGLLSQGLPNDVAVPVPALTQYAKALDTTICAFLQSYPLQGPAGLATHLWDNGDTTAVRSVSLRGTYWLRSASACAIRVDTFILRGADMPALSISRSGANLSATAGFASYQWFRDGQFLPGATGGGYVLQQNGLYKVRAEFGGGCSDSASLLVADLAAAVAESAAAGISVYPNPARGTLFIVSGKPFAARLYAADGRQVAELSSGNAMDIRHLTDGLYILRMSSADGERLGRERLIRVGR